jgi:hypothetical protein
MMSKGKTKIPASRYLFNINSSSILLLTGRLTKDIDLQKSSGRDRLGALRVRESGDRNAELLNRGPKWLENFSEQLWKKSLECKPA